MFDPDKLIRVCTLEEIDALPPNADGIFVCRLTDEKVRAIVARCPALRILIVDGNNRTTDASFLHLKRLQNLESLDLEWSAVTDAGLVHVLEMPSLKWIDLTFSEGVTTKGLEELRRARPDLEIDTQIS